VAASACPLYSRETTSGECWYEQHVSQRAAAHHTCDDSRKYYSNNYYRSYWANSVIFHENSSKMAILLPSAFDV